MPKTENGKPPVDAAESLAVQFEELAELCEGLTDGSLGDGLDYRIGSAIYTAWLHELLNREPAIRNAITVVVNNPPPEETIRQARSRFLYMPTPQPVLLREAIFKDVFGMLQSLGQIGYSNEGRSQLCQRLAVAVKAGAVAEEQAIVGGHLDAKYREGGESTGEPLTASYIAQPEKYGVSGSTLSRELKDHRLKYGRSYVYEFKEVAALSARIHQRND